MKGIKSKRILKNKINMTASLLGLFITKGNLGYGFDLSKDFINEETIVNIDGNGLDIIVEGLNITNSGVISGSSLIVQENLYTGNGISSGKSIKNIDNSGIISGVSSGAYDSVSGNGIHINSSVGNINNSGIISGTISSTKVLNSSIKGNGINISGNMGNVNNRGVISGFSEYDAPVNTNYRFIGNGIRSSAGSIGDINNSGIVSGYSTNLFPDSDPINSYSIDGNGIIASRSIGNVNNDGVISGYISSISHSISGNGITSSKIGIINNNGLIKGSVAPVSNTYSFLTNNGILVGETIDGKGEAKYLNNGTEIILDSTGDIVSVTNGVPEGLVHGKTIINGVISGNDSSTLSTGNYANSIINGAGVNKGALVVTGETTTIDSIINGYNTGVYLEGDSASLTATNTIFNGGGLKNDVAVIKGDSNANVVNILGESIINGVVDLGDGDDRLSIGNAAQVNGKLEGGLGNDILNLGEATAKTGVNLNITHDINGFESINTNGHVTLFETVNITGAENVVLESGDLVLRINPTIIKDGKITGHAFYGNEGTLSSVGGNLVIGLNGIGAGATISMGDTTVDPKMDDNWWKDTDHVKTNSLVLDAKVINEGKDIKITLLESIPEPPTFDVDSLLYKKLNKIYQSIVSAGEIGKLANTTLLEDKTHDESLEGLLTILDQIYANNPYAYTVKLSRDSLKLFEDNMSYLTIKPKKDEIIVQGRAIYTGVKNDTSDSKKNYYGFDIGHRNYKTTTNTAGGLATFEYGVSDKTSVGFVLGGNNQDVNFKGSSEVTGNSLYLGVFAKKDINNIKLMSGLGYQYSSIDADRKVFNRFDSFATGDKYDVNSLNAFMEAKYVYNAKQDWTVEPKVRLSYYYVNQDSVNEGYSEDQISMRADKINSKTADIEIGVDFVKSQYLNNGKLKNILSLGVINTIGDKARELNGYILGKEKDGTRFDIQGLELPETSGKVSYNLELEKTNGMIYTAGVSLEFAKDHNRNANATLGMGYRF